MGKLLAFVLAVFLWLGVAPSPASANVAGLTPCSESAEFQARAAAAVTANDVRRFEFYKNSGLLCGDEGLPHLIVDGRWSHAGEFMIPGLLFLYIAGWIGWVGRSYLQAIKQQGSPEEKEIVLDLPLALQTSLQGFAWPLAAFQQFSSGTMFAKDDEITVSPR